MWWKKNVLNVLLPSRGVLQKVPGSFKATPRKGGNMDHQAKKESATNVVQSRRWPVLHGVSILTHVLFPHHPDPQSSFPITADKTLG